MDIQNIIIELLILLMLFYLAFFKSYFSERGKNIALKEDIEILTKKVETVKSEIDLITKTKFDLATNERTAILDYHSKYSDWKNSIMKIYPSVLNENNYTNSEAFLDEIRTKELFFKNALDRFELLKKDREFSLLNNDVNVICLKMQTSIEKHFSKTVNMFIDLEYSRKTNTNEKHLYFYKKHIEQQKEIFEAFRDERLKLYTELIKHENILNDYLRRMLYKDME